VAAACTKHTSLVDEHLSACRALALAAIGEPNAQDENQVGRQKALQGDRYR